MGELSVLALLGVSEDRSTGVLHRRAARLLRAGRVVGNRVN